MNIYTLIEIGPDGITRYPTVSVESNEDQEFCNAYSAEFEFEEDPRTIWTTTNLKQLQNLINEPIGWYNSSMDRPELTKRPKCEYKTLLLTSIG